MGSDHRRSCLDYDFKVSVAYLRGYMEPWNMSTENTLSRHVSRLKIWSKRGKRDSENTYCSWVPARDMRFLMLEMFESTSRNRWPE